MSMAIELLDIARTAASLIGTGCFLSDSKKASDRRACWANKVP
jgi:hypothetical protein